MHNDESQQMGHPVPHITSQAGTDLEVLVVGVPLHSLDVENVVVQIPKAVDVLVER